MPNYLSFETERLILKPTTIEDADLQLELLNTPKWLQYIWDRNVKSLKAAVTYIETKISTQFERLGYGNYTVIRKSDGVKLGACGLYDRESLEGPDIGFALLPQHEKQGYAFEAASKVLEAAIEIFKIHKISAITLPVNKESQKLLEKLGLHFVKLIDIPNDPEQLMLYEYRIDE